MHAAFLGKPPAVTPVLADLAGELEEELEVGWVWEGKGGLQCHGLPVKRMGAMRGVGLGRG